MEFKKIATHRTISIFEQTGRLVGDNILLNYSQYIEYIGLLIGLLCVSALTQCIIQP